MPRRTRRPCCVRRSRDNRTTTSSTLTSDPPGAAAAARVRDPRAADPVYALALDSRTQQLTRGVRTVWARSAITLSRHVAIERGRPGGRGRRRAVRQERGQCRRQRVVAQATTDAGRQVDAPAPRGPSQDADDQLRRAAQPASAQAITIRQTVTPRSRCAWRCSGAAGCASRGRMRFEPLGSPAAAGRHPDAPRAAAGRPSAKCPCASAPRARYTVTLRRRAGGRRRQLRVPDCRSRDRAVRDRDLPDPTGAWCSDATRPTQTATRVAVDARSRCCSRRARVAVGGVAADHAPSGGRERRFLAYAPPPAGGARALCLVDTGVNADPRHGTRPRHRDRAGRRHRQRRRPAHARHDRRRGRWRCGPRRPWSLAATENRVRPRDRRSRARPSPILPVRRLRPRHQPLLTHRAPVRTSPQSPSRSSSVIPPTPDQVEDFDNAVSQAQAKGIAILAAAGNEPGPVQLPGSQPGILAVGAGDTVGGGICPFSASTGLTFFAPGCTIDQIDTAGTRSVVATARRRRPPSRPAYSSHCAATPRR